MKPPRGEAEAAEGKKCEQNVVHPFGGQFFYCAAPFASGQLQPPRIAMSKAAALFGKAVRETGQALDRLGASYPAPSPRAKQRPRSPASPPRRPGNSRKARVS